MGKLISLATAMGIVAATVGPVAIDASRAEAAIALPIDAPSVPLSKGLVLRVEAAIKTKLLDPKSAIFTDVRGFRIANDHIFVCGSVNSKNAFGGYVGVSPFSFEFVPDSAARDGLNGTLPAVWSNEISAQFFYESVAPACRVEPKY